MTHGPGGEHSDDILSAYLDDELAPAARREVETHLTGCAECRTELDEVAAARRAIRILPVHGAPYPLMQAAPRATTRRGRAAWAAVAVVAAAVAMFLPREPRVAPSLPSLADSHAARASVTGDPLTQLAPIAVPVRFGP
jgi:anti-sigma factor RsiW